MNELERRQLLKAAGAAGVAVPLLAACGGEDGPEAGDPQGQDSQGQDSQDSQDESTTREPSAPEDGSDGEGQGTTDGKRLAATSDIPVGGGKIFQSQKVVVTQPAEGDFKGFSAICTHNRCTVAEVVEGTINCPCHGSKFKVADGSVANGPATRPLDQVGITVEGDAVMLQA